MLQWKFSSLFNLQRLETEIVTNSRDASSFNNKLNDKASLIIEKDYASNGDETKDDVTTSAKMMMIMKVIMIKGVSNGCNHDEDVGEK